MDTRLKAALAAAAGTTLLLGGAGSLAYWNDVETVTGTTLDEGTLTLSALACGDWLLDDGAVHTTQVLSPGDSLTRTCTTTLDVEGEHLTGELSVEAAAWASGGAALTDELQTSVAYTLDAVDHTPASPPTAVDATDDGKIVTLEVEVLWPFGVLDDDANTADLAAVLDGVDLTLTQTDPH